MAADHWVDLVNDRIIEFHEDIITIHTLTPNTSSLSPVQENAPLSTPPVFSKTKDEGEEGLCLKIAPLTVRMILREMIFLQLCCTGRPWTAIATEYHSACQHWGIC